MHTGSLNQRTEVRRGRRECAEILEMLSHVVIVMLVTVGVAVGAFLHFSVHRTNTCSMTYMYRKLQFLEIPMPYGPSDKYSLMVYNEGRHWWNRSGIEAGQIPVLFIPGSQGSGKQVRSLASLMQNKTELRRAPFSFRFFAVDFDEEMTFMNGHIVNRQLDYVMKAIRRIQSMMQRVPRKIVLVGHSYGGMVAMLAALHADHRNDIDLVVLKGAPVNKQPILNDWLTLRLSLLLTQQWSALQANELSHVGVVAYSGGLRDYLIPDEWSRLPNVTHRPLWAIPDVSDLGVDHLAVLWCNEFVRHVSRLLWSYAENVHTTRGAVPVRHVIANFYTAQTDANVRRARLTRHISEVPAMEIKVGERYPRMTVTARQVVLFVKPQRFEILTVRVNASCVRSMTTVRYGESMMNFKNATADGVLEAWIYRALAGETVRLLLDVDLPCTLDVQLTNPIIVQMWRWYELAFSHLLEVISTFIVAICFFAALLREPLLKRAGVIALTNALAITALFHSCVDTNNTLALPMAVGYFMALAWRLVAFLVNQAILPRAPCIYRAHRALRDDLLTNGLFLVGGAVTLMASNEGSIFLILVLSFRHHPRAVLLVLPSIVPHCLRLAGFPFFSFDALTLHELQYHPAFYSACIYLWGLLSTRGVQTITMRMLMYGIAPALLYLLSCPLELYAGYSLLVFTAARFVAYAPRHQPRAVEPPSTTTTTTQTPPSVARGARGVGGNRQTHYNLRQRR